MMLADVLAPVPIDRFFAEFYGRAHLHVPASPSRPGSLPGLGVLEFLLATADARTLRVVRGPHELPVSALVDAEGVVVPKQVHAAFLEGHTVVVNGLHRRIPELWALARAVGAELGGAVAVNAYLTPAGGRGFPAHHDGADVFFLQLAGEKRWQVHAPAVELPDTGGSAVGALLAELVLRTGEVLYLPRGFGHAGRAGEGTSLHLTLSVTGTTARDRLTRLATHAAQDDVRLRRTGGALDDALAALATLAEPAPASLPPPLDWETSGRLHLDARLRRGAEVAARLLRQPDGLMIDRLAGTLRGPLGAEPAVRRILSGAPFTPRELPGLDDAGRLRLVGLLLAEGLLEWAE